MKAKLAQNPSRKYVVGILPNLDYLEPWERSADAIWLSCSQAGERGFFAKCCPPSQIYCIVAHARLKSSVLASVASLAADNGIKLHSGENWDVVIESVRLQLKYLNKVRLGITCF